MATDKQPGYIEIYQQLFEEPADVNLVMEIGVLNGDGLKMFCDMFPLATVVGVDIQLPEIYHERIRLEQVDQRDGPALSKMGQRYNEFDLIVDDGCHLGSAMAISWRWLFQFVKPEGYYVIEDWGVAYWPGWEDSPMPLLHKLIDICGSGSDVRSVSFYQGTSKSANNGQGHLAVIQKRF
jgi:hypothetical protein